MQEFINNMVGGATHHPWASIGVATLACIFFLVGCFNLGHIYLWPLLVKWWALPALFGIGVGGPVLAIVVATGIGLAVFAGAIGVVDAGWFVTGAFCYLAEKLGILEDRKLPPLNRVTLRNYPAKQKTALGLIERAFEELKDADRNELVSNTSPHYSQLKKWYTQFQKNPLRDKEIDEIIEDISVYLFTANFYIPGFVSYEVSSSIRWLLQELEKLYPPKSKEELDKRRSLIRPLLEDKGIITVLANIVLDYESATISDSTMRVMRLINSNKLWGEAPKGIKAMRRNIKVNTHNEDETLKILKQIAEQELPTESRYFYDSYSYLFYTRVVASRNMEDLANKLSEARR